MFIVLRARSIKPSSVRSEMWMVDHISLLTELKKSGHISSYKHFAPTELTSVRHGSLYFVLQKMGVAGLRLRSTANATNPIV